MSSAPVIVWYRQDLRLADHPALAAAAAGGRPVVPVYCLVDAPPPGSAPGGASRWWLHNSLASLAASLAACGSRLLLRRGRPATVLAGLARETGAEAVHVTRGYQPDEIAAEIAVRDALQARGVALRRFPGRALFEPEAIRSRTGEPFRVFTPFWRACLAAAPPDRLLPAPQQLAAPAGWPAGDELSDWRLLPTRPDWAGGLRATWTPGEAGAGERLRHFLDARLAGYGAARDRPDRPATSMLSPHLHFGEIGPRQVWQAARMIEAAEPGSAGDAAKFLSELGWREFSIHLLFHFPHIAEAPFRPEFARFPWREAGAAAADLDAWQRGRTGYPLVDAGMRQLWHTGWMHNRVRMIVASLLTKHLLVPWQAGAAWFWDTLVDADLASNAASWQWVAGSGADAAPYFRIFNPMLQGAKFDPDGSYVSRWVPELARLPAAHIHAPWQAPAPVLAAAGVAIGRDYPLPIVEAAAGRAAALAAYDAIKGGDAT